MTNVGKVIQIIGPVVDCEFEEKHLPPIYNCVIIEGEAGGQSMRVSTEVQQHLGERQIRCVSMQPTDGMVRGMKAIDTGKVHQKHVAAVNAGAARPFLDRNAGKVGNFLPQAGQPIE